MIVSGSASQSLAARLAAELNEPLVSVDYDRFPDGERYVQIEPTDSDRAIVVGSTVSSGAHIELLQLQDAAREAGAEQVVTVIPYMGYARQDKAFNPGEPVSARAIAQAISTGTDRILTVSPHEETVCEYFSPPATAIAGERRLAKALPDDLIDPAIIAPDEGAVSIAETVRDAYGGGTVDFFRKVRHSGTDVDVTGVELDLEERDVVIVDDIIATGSTMSESVAQLNTQQPNRIFVACVHALLARNARTKLSRAGVASVLGTDTIERPESTVSVAPLVAAALS